MLMWGSGFRLPRCFSPWPEEDEDDSKPILLRIGPGYRVAFNTLLTRLLSASKSREIIIVSEWNGDVTQARTKQEALEQLASGAVRMYGPYDLETFWQMHDIDLIEYPSITLVEEMNANMG